MHDSLKGRIIFAGSTAAFAYATFWLLVLVSGPTTAPIRRLFGPL